MKLKESKIAGNVFYDVESCSSKICAKFQDLLFGEWDLLEPKLAYGGLLHFLTSFRRLSFRTKAAAGTVKRLRHDSEARSPLCKMYAAKI